MEWVIGILLDVVLVAILLLCIRGGSKNGFAKTVVSFAGIFIAIILAATLSKPAATFAYTNFAQKPIETTIETAIKSQTDELSESAPSAQQLLDGFDSATEKLPAFVKNMFKSDEKKAELSDHIVEQYTSDITEFSKKITEAAVKPLIILIISVVVFFVLFFTVLIICAILSKALKIVNKLPLLGGVNSLLGGVLGALKGAVIVLIINFVIVSVTSSGGDIFGIITAKTVESSLIMKNLALVNPLNAVISSVLGTK